VFSNSNWPATSQVKFTTCTLQDDALTWWNAMPWVALKKMMTDKYCPRGEIKKIKTEMWNLQGQGHRRGGLQSTISATSFDVFQDVPRRGRQD
ncbi:hypothetical protein Tco_0284588, partial [Tanacetum coccineum]